MLVSIIDGNSHCMIYLYQNLTKGKSKGEGYGHIVTCGIYMIFFWSNVGDDINIIASRRDGQKTMHYCLMSFVLAPITCGIYAFVWWHKLSNRIGEEARSRGIQTGFDASTFWLWAVLGSFLCGIGPFIYMHKLCTTMNYISADYNQRGF